MAAKNEKTIKYPSLRTHPTIQSWTQIQDGGQNCRFCSELARRFYHNATRHRDHCHLTTRHGNIIRALCMVVEELLRLLILDPDVQSMAQLKAKLQQYRATSRTVKQWIDCLTQPIFIMLLFVRAEREGDCLCIVYLWMIWCHIYLHVGISTLRDMPYCISMQYLHPALFKPFMVGGHVMNHTDGLWKCIWSDLSIESTYLRYGHGPSGIIGATLSETSLAV